MRKIGLLGLLLLTIFVFAVVLVSNVIGQGASTSTIDKTQTAQMIKPTLESYMTKHPNMQVRIWSMVVLTNIDGLAAGQLSSVTSLLQQMGSKDMSVRQIASSSIRSMLTLEEKQWKVIAGTIFLTIAKTTKYPEIRKLAIQSIAVLQRNTTGTSTTGTSTTGTSSESGSTAITEEIDSLLLLFDLAEDEDPEIRQIATDSIKKTLESFDQKDALSSGYADYGFPPVPAGPLPPDAAAGSEGGS